MAGEPEVELALPGHPLLDPVADLAAAAATSAPVPPGLTASASPPPVHAVPLPGACSAAAQRLQFRRPALASAAASRSPLRQAPPRTRLIPRLRARISLAGARACGGSASPQGERGTGTRGLGLVERAGARAREGSASPERAGAGVGEEEARPWRSMLGRGGSASPELARPAAAAIPPPLLLEGRRRGDKRRREELTGGTPVHISWSKID
ncbi:hypothetical protein ACQJBY_060801 [Aegilops geniculata]